MMNENVLKLLRAGMWDLATCADGEPNVVPVAFKDVTEDGKLVVGDVFLETMLQNMYLRAQLSTPLKLWWKRCSTGLLQQRERLLSLRKRLL